jgi:branched-chain amino acid transport system permease protein
MWLRAALRLVSLALAAGVLLVLPSFVSDFRASELARVGIFFTAILGLNVLTGYTGQISLGHGAFMAVGGYTTAILISDHGVKDVYTIALAGLVAGVAGFLFGLPALRLSGPYLALATFAVAVATPTVIRRFDDLTGGSSGILLFEEPGLTGALFNVVHVGGRTLTFNDWLYYLTWTIALVLFVVAWAIHHSRLGRALRAIRDSEVAAASSGVNLAAYKTLAFAISAFYAGVAGALLAISATAVQPGSFPVELSIQLLIGLAIGGLGSLAPLLAGAVVIVFLPQWAQEISTSPGVPTVVYGAALIVTMFLLRNGLGGLLRRVGEPLTTRLYSRP